MSIMSKPKMNEVDEEAYSHFKETLYNELTQNIKPIILSLTMLAEDYRDSGHVITQSIEEYVKKVSPDIKILGLYLMDSIMKNIKQKTNYVKLFEENIVSLFSFVFESVNENNRKALYKLRQTWNDIFSHEKLHQLDVSVKKIDPAWPITAIKPLSTSNINVNANNNNKKLTNNTHLDQSNISKSTTLPNQNNSNNSNNNNNIHNNNSNVNSINNKSAGPALDASNKTVTNNSSSNSKSLTVSSSNSSKSAVVNNSSNNNLNQEAAKTKQPNNTSPINESNKKQSTNKESANMSNGPIRDPRLVNRVQKQQQSQQQLSNNTENLKQPVKQIKPQQQKSNKSASPPPKRVNVSETSNKSSSNLSNGIKRASPNNSQQTPVEIKKPKMSVTTPPSTTTSNNNINESPLKQNKQIVNANKATTSINQQSTSSTDTSKTLQQRLDAVKQKLLASQQESIKKSNETTQTNDGKTTKNSIKKTVLAQPIRQIKLLEFDELSKPSTNVSNSEKHNDKTAATTSSTNMMTPSSSSDSISASSASNSNSESENHVNKVAKKKIPSLFDLNIEPPKNNASTKTKVINQQKIDETPLTFCNDVDERFADSMNKQIDSFTHLIPSNNSNLDIDNDNMYGLNETAVINKLETNSNSLNVLKERLIESQQNDKINNQSNASTNTQDLIKMIQELLTQQKQLMDEHNRRKNGISNLHQPEHLDEHLVKSNNNNIMCENQISSPLLPSSQPASHTNLIDLQNQVIDNTNENDQEMDQQQSYSNDVVSYSDLPPIRPRDKNENQNDSLLIIDGRSYRIQPDVRRLIKIYYHDHELFCDTRTKDVYLDKKRVYKMGDTTKEVMLNGRRVRLMYMGKRIELWLDGISFHFRADSPPKQISLTSSHSNQLKKYYVTIDSKTMDMYFNNFKVCQINGGPHGNGPNIIMARLAPDDYEQHEISFVCPPKRIMIDGVPRKMRYDLAVPCIEMDNGEYFIIRFSGPAKEIYIDDHPYLVEMDKTSRIKLNNRTHELAWGGPGFEVIVDGKPYEIQFNKPAREIIIGTRPHFVCICGDPPDVKICGRVPDELLQFENENQMMDQDNNNFNVTSKPVPLMSQPIAAPSGQPSISLPPAFDIQKLVQKLNEHGILPNLKKEDQIKEEPNKQQTAEIIIPDLTNFDVESLKKKYDGAIQKLYSGVQCSQCGNRFNQNNETNSTGGVGGASRYSKHLDWHFRQNKKEKEEINKAHSRAWYYTLPDWLLFEELSEDAEMQMMMQMDVDNNTNQNTNTNRKSNHDENNDNESISSGSLLEEDLNMPNKNIINQDENDHQQQQSKVLNINNNLSNMLNKSISSTSTYNNLNGIKTCPATNDVGDSCHICNDPFDIFFFEEKEEWHFKDAVRVGNRLYHPICLEDANHNDTTLQNMSSISIPTTPSSNSINPFNFNNSNNNNNGSFVKDEPID